MVLAGVLLSGMITPTPATVSVQSVSKMVHLNGDMLAWSITCWQLSDKMSALQLHMQVVQLFSKLLFFVSRKEK